MNREAIYSAVFARLQTIDGFTTVTRRLQHWADVTPSEMPYIAMAQRSEYPEGSRMGMPLRWTFAVDFYLYTHSADRSSSPCIILNPLLDRLCTAFMPSTRTGTVELAGLTYHCRIDGEIETDEGTLGDLSVAIVPLSITLPE